MGHPGRPRRRNKIQTPFRPLEEQPISHPKPTFKDELAIQLHDEADLISYRTDAARRFISNQEYMEKVVSTYIQSTKIIPPRSFPEPPSRQARTHEDWQKITSDLKPDEVYIGDLKIMKIKNKILEDEVERLNAQLQLLPSNDEGFVDSKEHINRLAQLQFQVHDKNSFNELQVAYDSIVKEQEEKYNKKFTMVPKIRKHSESIDKLSNGSVQVSSAPPNYDPRLVSTFINMNGKGEGDDSVAEEPFYENGKQDSPFINGFERQDEYEDLRGDPGDLDSQLSDNMGLNSNIDMNKNELPYNPDTNEMDDDINILFDGTNNDKDVVSENAGNEDNNGIVNEMENLFNFQNDDDENLGDYHLY